MDKNMKCADCGMICPLENGIPTHPTPIPGTWCAEEGADVPEVYLTPAE